MNGRDSIFERIRCAIHVLLGTPVIFRVDFAGDVMVKRDVFWAACPGTLQSNGRELFPWFPEKP